MRIPTTQSAPLVAIAAVALTTLLASALALASRADAYIYWTSSNGIGRANLDGTGANPSFIPEAGSPGGVAVDGAHVYWVNLETGTIGRANLDGTGANPSFITAPIEGGSGVAVDAAHIYWVSKFADEVAPPIDRPFEPGTGAIGRANLDGSGVDASFITGISFPVGDVAVGASHLYWTSYHPDTNFFELYYFPTRIGRASLDGTGVEENFISTATPAGVAVDEAHVWWTDLERFSGGIGRANLDGANTEFVIGTRENFYPDGIAVDDTYVYWTEGFRSGRARLDGSRATQKLITCTPPDSCGEMAVDALGPPPSNAFRFGGVRVNKKRGSAKLMVNVAGPGELKLAKTGNTKRKHKRARESGKEKLSVEAKGKAKKKLNQNGRAKVKAKVTYTPDGGEPNTKSKKIKLVER